MACLATDVRGGSVEVDHLSAEIALGAVPYLSGLDIKILHLDVELVERMGRQPDENFLSVIWISFPRAIRQYPILPLLAVASRTQRDCLGKFVGDIVPFVVPERG